MPIPMPPNRPLTAVKSDVKSSVRDFETLEDFASVEPTRTIREMEFDFSVRHGEFGHAAQIADEELVILQGIQKERGRYLNPLTRFTMKRASLPNYKRLFFDKTEQASETEHPDVVQAHLQLMRLLESLRNRRLPYRVSPKETNGPYGEIFGIEAEITVMGLITRLSDGTDSDTYSTVPAAFIEDHARKSGSRKSGFDLLTYHRPSNQDIHTQVKSSRAEVKPYTQSVDIVYLSKLMDGNEHVDDLKLALINETHGSLKPVQKHLVERATDQLFTIYERRLARLAREHNEVPAGAL